MDQRRPEIIFAHGLCCAVWCVRKSNSFNLKLTMGFYRGMNLIASPTALQRRLQCPSALGTIQKQHRKSVFSSDYNIADPTVNAKSQPATTPVYTVIFSPRRKSPRHIIFIQPTSTRATERLYTSNFFSSFFFLPFAGVCCIVRSYEIRMEPRLTV